MLKVFEKAFAKINLTLAVTGKRDDGYHRIQSLFQSISLYDGLVLECQEKGFSLNDVAQVPADENIIARADRLLRQEFPYLGGVRVTLEKNIPTQAGLGGGSTDAAAYLRGVNRLYELGLSNSQLAVLGSKLGADVPFCLEGGTAIATGIGEILKPVESNLLLNLVVTKPESGCSTPQMYKRIDEEGNRLQQRFTAEEAARGLAAGDISMLCGSLYNVFENVTSLPELNQIRQELMQSGSLAALMTGSGSAIFGIYSDEDTAKAAAKKMGETRWTVCCQSIGLNNNPDSSCL